MAIGRLIGIMTMFLSLAACAGPPEDGCELKPGIGCGAFKIGKTKRAAVFNPSRDQQYYSKRGLDFSFDSNGALDTIVATSTMFVSDKGIRPGDPEGNVELRYGKPTVGRYELQKGSPSPAVTIGEKTLVYPGIQFVIAERKVWAIVIVPKP
jgi:hypothetical protein